MPVGNRFIDIIIRRDSIASKFAGGWEGFLKSATKESDITLIIDSMRKNIYSPGFRIGTKIDQFDQNKITKSETFETEDNNNTVSFSLDRISGMYTWNIKSDSKKINYWANNKIWGQAQS